MVGGGVAGLGGCPALQVQVQKYPLWKRRMEQCVDPNCKSSVVHIMCRCSRGHIVVIHARIHLCSSPTGRQQGDRGTTGAKYRASDSQTIKHRTNTPNCRKICTQATSSQETVRSSHPLYPNFRIPMPSFPAKSAWSRQSALALCGGGNCGCHTLSTFNLRIKSRMGAATLRRIEITRSPVFSFNGRTIDVQPRRARAGGGLTQWGMMQLRLSSAEYLKSGRRSSALGSV